MNRTLLLLAALAVAGCTTAPVHLKNPATGEVATCGPYMMDGAFSDAQAQREARCIGDFQQQGYVRLP